MRVRAGQQTYVRYFGIRVRNIYCVEFWLSLLYLTKLLVRIWPPLRRITTTLSAKNRIFKKVFSLILLLNVAKIY